MLTAQAWATRATLRVAAVVLAVAGCSTNPVAVHELSAREAFLELRRNAISGELSVGAVNLLNALGQEQLLDATPAEIVRALRGGQATLERPQAALLVELLIRRGDQGRSGEAEPCFVEAALVAARALAQAPASPEFAAPDADLIELYDYALTRLLIDGEDLALAPSQWVSLRGIGCDYAVQHGAASTSSWDPAFFDEVLPAWTQRVEGIRSRHVRRGLGVPLIAIRHHGTALRPLERYYPPEGRAYPATLLLLPGPGEGRVSVTLLDPRGASTCDVLGRQFPLAADFTATHAYQLAGAELPALGDTAFFDPDAAVWHQGLFLLEPYSSTKVPVVLIHGLWSSPLTWRELTNEIWGDEALRARYQVWHYTYPTGAPILNNARDLRRALVEIRTELDPDGDDVAMRDIVLVGHSMGGVLAKAVVQASGERLWDARFTRPLAALELSDEGREYAQSTFFFEPVPFVQRVVFLAAPHRGSLEADSFFGRLGSWLMSRTRRVQGFAAEVERRNPGAMRPEHEPSPSSVDVLSPSHVVLRTLAELPIAPWVSYHTIVGDLTGGTGADRDDGIVALASSHLDGAASELVVGGAGHDVHLHPVAIAEVMRVLREHRAEEQGAAGR